MVGSFSSPVRRSRRQAERAQFPATHRTLTPLPAGGKRCQQSCHPADPDAVTAGPEGLREALEREPASYLLLLSAARVGAEEASRLLHEAVTSARGAGHSWEAVGAILGVSRQAAQQRFGHHDGAIAGPNQKVLSPLTAFNEMAALAAAGSQGWHLVGFGPFHHVEEASDQQWAHRRDALSVGPRRRRLEADGWQGVGAWFPWRYYKRPLGRAPELQDPAD